MTTAIIPKSRIRGKSKRKPIDSVVKPAKKAKKKRKTTGEIIGSFYSDMGIPRPPHYITAEYDDSDTGSYTPHHSRGYRRTHDTYHDRYFTSWQDQVLADAEKALTTVKENK